MYLKNLSQQFSYQVQTISPVQIQTILSIFFFSHFQIPKNHLSAKKGDDFFGTWEVLDYSWKYDVN